MPNVFSEPKPAKSRQVTVNLTAEQGRMLDALGRALELRTGAAVVKRALADLVDATFPDGQIPAEAPAD